MRTSLSHPLRIDEIPLGNGQLGITFCPGKKGDSVFGAAWNRDLNIDINTIKTWGADAVLTLIEDHEFEMLSVPHLGAAIEAQSIEWFHFPIRDLNTPTPETMKYWRELSPKLHRIIERGGRVIVHCRGGLGRAGTVAALLLTERGWSARQAVLDVRTVRPGTIETAEQERWLTSIDHDEVLQSVQLRASLLGGAIGDSLGAEIEFLSLDMIRRQHPNGILDLPPHQGLRGAITDDTQMTLFTAEGIIGSYARDALKGSCHPPSVVHHALLRWHRTQGGKPRVKTDDTGLISDPRLWARRAPGLTCLSALAESKHFGMQAKNDSKGCGTIMRVAPVALMVPRDQVRSLAVETSALTHGHPTGQLAAAAWAEMLADVAAGNSLEDTAANTAAVYARIKGGGETTQSILKALNAPRDGAPETVEALGGGWTAEEALSIALYACLTSQTFDEGLQIAIMHSGDSDSTGATAGNMLGLLYSQTALKHRWAQKVEGADILSRIAHDYYLLTHRNGSAEQLWQDYPGT